MPNLTWHTKSNLTHFVHLSTRQRALLVEVGGRGKEVNEAERTACWGADKFFLICQWGKENFFLRGWHIFFICQRDNEHCSLRLGGEGKSQWGKENCLLRGWHIFFICQRDNKHCSLRLGGEGKKSMTQRELLVEVLTHFIYLSMRQRELLFEGLTHFFYLSTRQ